MNQQDQSQLLWDILVVGSGPAGLSAAINGRVRNKSVLVLGAEIGSDRLRKAPEINNYPGLPGISGEELQHRILEQARQLGAVVEKEQIETIYPGREFSCVTRSNRLYRSRAVIMATGVRQSSYLPGEQELLGKGVGYCATCDGAFYRNKRVAVIAETPEGAEDASFLADICSKVYYFPRYGGEIKADKRVEVRTEKVTGIKGSERVTGLATASGEIPLEGVFIVRKVAPVERLVEGLSVSDGAVVVDREMATGIPGLFAAGDCTGKPYQIGKAVGEGLTAALSAVHYLDNLPEKEEALSAR